MRLQFSQGGGTFDFKAHHLAGIPDSSLINHLFTGDDKLYGFLPEVFVQFVNGLKVHKRLQEGL